jgi:hypothetical protein
MHPRETTKLVYEASQSTRSIDVAGSLQRFCDRVIVWSLGSNYRASSQTPPPAPPAETTTTTATTPGTSSSNNNTTN